MVTSTTEPVGSLLFGKTRRAVLGLLFTRPDESFHLRQIVRLSGAGLGPVQREAAKLTAAGLLVREQRGRQVFYAANTHSPVYDELRGLVVKTAGLGDVLREALTPLAPSIRCAFVYGSLARGQQHRESDVDVMVIGDLKFTDVARALAPAQHRLGREINPTVYGPLELARKLAEKHHFLTQVLARPKIYLLGDDDELSRVAQERLAPPAHHGPGGSRRLAGRHRP